LLARGPKCHSHTWWIEAWVDLLLDPPMILKPTTYTVRQPMPGNNRNARQPSGDRSSDLDPARRDFRWWERTLRPHPSYSRHVRSVNVKVTFAFVVELKRYFDGVLLVDLKRLLFLLGFTRPPFSIPFSPPRSWNPRFEICQCDPSSLTVSVTSFSSSVCEQGCVCRISAVAGCSLKAKTTSVVGRCSALSLSLSPN